MESYFFGCRDLKAARKVYIELCKKHHPDIGGDVKIMQEINKQFDEFKKTGIAYASTTFGRGYSWTGVYTNAAWKDLHERLRKGTFYTGGKTHWDRHDFSKEDEWDEDIEREANRQEKEKNERLKERMEKLAKEAQEARDTLKAQALAEKIYMDVNRQIRENFATSSIKQMMDIPLNQFLSVLDLTKILKGKI